MSYQGLQLRVFRMLIAVPESRERRNKDYYLVKLLTSNWTREIVPSDAHLVNLVKDYNTADRFWRKCLEDHQELRGSDYAEKKKLAQKKMLELGYQPGYPR